MTTKGRQQLKQQHGAIADPLTVPLKRKREEIADSQSEEEEQEEEEVGSDEDFGWPDDDGKRVLLGDEAEVKVTGYQKLSSLIG